MYQTVLFTTELLRALVLIQAAYILKLEQYTEFLRVFDMFVYIGSLQERDKVNSYFLISLITEPYFHGANLGKPHTKLLNPWCQGLCPVFLFLYSPLGGPLYLTDIQ